MELTQQENTVYKAIQAGMKTGKAVGEATGMDVGAVNIIILRLVKYGLVESTGSGKSRRVHVLQGPRKNSNFGEILIPRQTRPVTVYHLDTSKYLMEKYGCLNPDPKVRDKLANANYYTTAKQHKAVADRLM